MSNMQDAPRQVRPMVDVLKEFGEYRFDPADVFRDFIDYGIGCLLVHGDLDMGKRLLDKYGADYAKFGTMLRAWIGILDKEVAGDGQWFDALGSLYEYLASQNKRSWLGQFFTPASVCDLMTMLTIQNIEGTGKRVNDPAVGSGRTLLSINSRWPGNYMFGEDIDPICAKMAALNLAFHGAQGQISCLDSLRLNSWKFGYELNPYHRHGAPPIPHLLPITEEGSVVMQHWRQRVPDVVQQPVEKVAKPAPIPEPKPVFTSQLSLF
ncbi:N-6 DNA methylase [Arundinibacter roseus]|uniref:SAM-dependent DNA methyltransferase n=1 Tax=Arundinibacter roseus TaxID=2070510 RepID=A0A4V6P8M4_9BACT|nr:N-6 DNA methylase [Arundinibacter roseus]TDB64405.1 SAM-dependent DNA methyltransferase [Arundinibacter roseus]